HPYSYLGAAMSLITLRRRFLALVAVTLVFSSAAALLLASRSDAGPNDTLTLDTIAGNGTNVDTDNVAATQTGLNWPASVARDSQGNLYIAETWGDRIRKIDLNGTVTTVVSVPKPGYVTLDAQDRLYVSRPFNNEVD